MAISSRDFRDGVTFTAGGNGDSVTFQLVGGRYAFGANATWGGGNLALQILMPDGSTYVACATALTADGFEVLILPPGTYKFVVTTASSVQGFVLPVPYRQA